MTAEITQTPGLNIFQLDILPEILTADGHPPTVAPLMSGSALKLAPETISKRARVMYLTQELKEITTLYNISVTVGSSLDLEQVIWTLYKESSRLLDASNFGIIIYETHTDTLNFALIFEQGQRCQQRSMKRTDCPRPVGRVLATQASVLTHDLSNDEPIGMNPVCPKQQIRSWLGVPIFNPMLPDEGVQGVIATWSYEPSTFGDHELWLLSAIGTQAAIAMRNARLYEAILAERDRVIAAQEEARRALAHELHDGPTQLVSAISMRLDFCQRLLEKNPTLLAGEIGATQELARQAVHQIRTLLFELRPLALETQGLQNTVELFLERRQEDVGEQPHLALKVETSNPDGEIARQEEKVEAALFAIVQETVNNALKHAQAKNIVVRLKETSTAFYVMIIDDGNSFDVEQVLSHYEQRGSLGIINIQERADLIGSELRLESAPGRGTRVIVRVPKAEVERLRKRGATGPLRVR